VAISASEVGEKKAYFLFDPTDGMKFAFQI
jgi:hypothetical protein